MLAAYGIEKTKTQIAHTASEAGAIAEKFDEPVALKILSPDITHKSDGGGVVLDLQSPDAVEAAAHLIAERVGKAALEARITGFVVQSMVHRPRAYELIVGVAEDAQFGPTVLFGQGGTAVEVIKDKALALPPLDINPLLADDSGAIALVARIRVKPLAGPPQVRLAIKPYPRELEEQVTLGDGRTLLLRPIRTEDQPALQAGFAKLTPEEVRFRFFVPMKTLDHFMGARLADINYDRQMALVLTNHGSPGKAEIYGVVRVSADPDNERGEFALIVRGDMTGMGLGVFLMRHIIGYCKARGMEEIYGDVLRENKTMLKLCDFLGFEKSRTAVDPAAVRVTLTL